MSKLEFQDKIAKFESAMDEILKAHSLTDAKEIAADLLDVDVDDYLVDDLDLDEADLPDDPFERYDV